MAKGRILLAEDEASVRKTLAIGLNSRGYEVDEAGSGEEALQLAGGKIYDVVIADVDLPGISGIDVMRRLRSGGCPVVLISGNTPADAALEGVLAGAASFLSKPFELEELCWLVERSLRRGADHADGRARGEPDQPEEE